jgi:hypothetical protein
MQTSKIWGLVAAAALGASCAPGAKEDTADTAETATVQSAINSSASCFNTAAASTFLGGGTVLTPDNYNPSTCPRAYMIELRNYSTAYSAGAYATWAGATATNQADCESSVLNAYVWKSDGTFLRSFRKYSQWAPDIRGVNRCIMPSIHLDYMVPGFKWGGSYKIALQAGNATAYQKISFATVKSTTPATALTWISSMVTKLNATTGGAIHPAVQAVFNKKGTTAIARMCRATQLDRAFSQYVNAAIIRAGASPQTATDRDAGLSSIYTALCTSSGTVDGLQNGLKQWGSSITLARDGIRSLIPGMSGSDAATALESVTQQALGKLIANCGLKQDTLLSFLYDGTLPAGKTADNLLLGSCSGTPLQVAANLGEGQNFTSDTLTAARDRYLKCLNDDFGQQRCNDPRADDAPVDDNNPVAPDSSESTCTQFSADGPDGSLICTDPQVNQLEQIEAALAGTGIVISEDEAQQILYDSQVAHDTALAARAAGYADNVLTVTGLGTLGTGTAAKIEFGSAVTTGALTTAAAVLGYVTSAAKFVSWGCKNYPEQCGAAIRRSADYAHCDPMGFCYGPEGVRKPSGSNKMCAPDFDTGGAGWYQTDGKPSASRQLTQDDRINHCTCELLDAKYSGRASSLKASVGCPSAEEKFREDCIAQPDPRSLPNPDASPVKPECLNALSPPTNLVTRQTRICNAVLCGSGEMRMTYLDGTCGCVAVFNDPAQGIPCTNGLFSMCTGEDPNSNTCGCPPLNPGPIGNDPLCQYIPNNTNWPGLLSGFSVVNRADVFPSVIGSQQFAMVKPNKSLVGPTIFTRSLTKVPAASTSNPPKLRVSALISKKPPTGGNIDLQIYITSRGTPSGTMPLTHDFAGQVRLNNLTAGAATQVDIPLFVGSSQATMLSRGFSGKSLNIEYTLQAPSGYARYIGIGAQDFVGASTARPSTDTAAICLPPTPTDPIGPVLIPNPLAPLATPASPGTFTLSNGNLTQLTDRVPVLRTITQP